MTSSTPVLFLIFRRPDLTQEVFNEIRKAKPKKLFVCADGPRADKPGEEELCARTRAIIDQVDWDCQVYKRYSDVNLGCRVAVNGGLNWFFEQVESGIILEDDCLASQSFFNFCEELLERYKDDKRIMQISGINYFPDKAFGNDTYYFVKLNDISGWATWARAWKLNDPTMGHFPAFKKQGRIRDYIHDRKQAAWLMSYFEEAVDIDKCGIWSSPWTFAMCINNGLTINPNVSLTKHLGYNAEGTNFQKGSEKLDKIPIQIQEIDKIVHPSVILPNEHADACRFELIRKTDVHATWWYQKKQAIKIYLKEILDTRSFEQLSKFFRKVRGYS